MKKLIIIGASGHGKVIADISALCGYKDISFLDDNKNVNSCMSYPVVGKSSDAEKYRDADFFVAIGNAKAREKVQEILQRKGLNIATLIHPDAVIAKSAFIGIGTVIMAGTVVNPDTRIGEGCIINTGASVDHDNGLGEYVHVSVGAHIAGTVHIGKRTWIGAGAVVSNNVNICGDCMIGAGAVVVKNIDRPGTYVGVPARKVEMMKNKVIQTACGGVLLKKVIYPISSSCLAA